MDGSSRLHVGAEVILRKHTTLLRFNLGGSPETIVPAEVGAPSDAERRITVTSREGTLIEYILSPVGDCENLDHGAPLCCTPFVIKADQQLIAIRKGGGVEAIVSVRTEYLS